MQHARISVKHLTTVPTAAAKLPPTSSVVSTGIWTTPRSAGNGERPGLRLGSSRGLPARPLEPFTTPGAGGSTQGAGRGQPPRHRGRGAGGCGALQGPGRRHQVDPSCSVTSATAPGPGPATAGSGVAAGGGPAPGCPLPRSGQRAVGHGKAPRRWAEWSWGQRGSAGAQQHTHVSCPPCLFYLYFSNLLIASFLTNQQ